MIDDLWYKHAVIYCLDVGTFMDSNADGVGDFEGLTRRLDYLSGLGLAGLVLERAPPPDDRRSGRRRCGCRLRLAAIVQQHR